MTTIRIAVRAITTSSSINVKPLRSVPMAPAEMFPIRFIRFAVRFMALVRLDISLFGGPHPRPLSQFWERGAIRSPLLDKERAGVRLPGDVLVQEGVVIYSPPALRALPDDPGTEGTAAHIADRAPGLGIVPLPLLGRGLGML